MTTAQELPAGTIVFERGWLSANNILLVGAESTALVDSGYWTHAKQTVELVSQALGDRSLDVLLNTHLHSDHCGGNAALQKYYPRAKTFIPPGLAQYVAHWDPYLLTYAPTGQQCPEFRFNQTLQPGHEITLGDFSWQIHAAPGHDPHSVILFEPQSRALLSADALWKDGFGIVFPELEGSHAFEEVAATLDLIESLMPKVVVPGHGSVFSHVSESLSLARGRLDSFVRDPQKHARHAGKVLLKFKLLEVQRIPFTEFLDWAATTPYFDIVRSCYFPDSEARAWIEQLSNDLVRSGAAMRDAEFILNN